MISLTCTSCKKTLQIDDAFAGGVCRCQFCGTIQTVPAAAKTASRPGAPPPVTTGAKTLYQKKGRAAAAAQSANQSGSGLDDLADAVASSSGLARGALRTRAATPVAPPPPAKDSKRLLLAVVAALVVIIVILLAILILR